MEHGGKNIQRYIPTIHYHHLIRILGGILLLIGLILIFFTDLIDITISFGLIIIGTFMMIFISQRYIPASTSDAKVKGGIKPIYRIIIQLGLKGNCVFIPKSKQLNEERIFIPPNHEGNIKIPKIADDTSILKDSNGTCIGLLLPPSGLDLLDEIDKEKDFENTSLKNIESNLKKFIGIDLYKSISLSRILNGYRLELEVDNPDFCFKNRRLCRQYPCPICSAVLTAISRSTISTEKRLWVKDVQHKGSMVVFFIHFLEKEGD